MELLPTVGARMAPRMVMTLASNGTTKGSMKRRQSSRSCHSTRPRARLGHLRAESPLGQTHLHQPSQGEHQVAEDPERVGRRTGGMAGMEVENRQPEIPDQHQEDRQDQQTQHQTIEVRGVARGLAGQSG